VTCSGFLLPGLGPALHSVFASPSPCSSSSTLVAFFLGRPRFRLAFWFPLYLVPIILKLPHTVHKSSESWLSAVAVATVGTVRRQVGHLLDKALRRTFGSSSRQLVQLQAYKPSDEPCGSSSRQLALQLQAQSLATNLWFEFAAAGSAAGTQA
jgi:hypothetical protein